MNIRPLQISLKCSNRLVLHIDLSYKSKPKGQYQPPVTHGEIGESLANFVCIYVYHVTRWHLCQSPGVIRRDAGYAMY